MKAQNVIIYQTLPNELLEKWQALWNDSDEATFFNAPQWFVSCKNKLGFKKFVIITIEKDGKLDAILPLVQESKVGVAVFCSPGERFVDKTSLLLRKQDASLISALINKLSELGNFYLQEVNEKTATQISKLNIKNLKVKESSTNYYLPLTEDPFQFMSNKNRNKIKNRIKNNVEHLSHKSYLGDEEGLTLVFDMDKRSSKYKQGKSTFVRERERAFFRELLKQHGKDFSIDILFYDNKPFIYGIVFTDKKSFNACITAYDDTFIALSPGKMLQFHMLPRLQQAGYEIFDFSRGITEFKKDFTPLFHTQYDVSYATNASVHIWWTAAAKTKEFVLQNKILYGTYLKFKKLLSTH